MKLHSFAVLVLVALIPSAPLVATMIYVDASNTAPPWDGSPAYPYQLIQDGLDNAADGDTVTVRDGTYMGDGNRDLDFKGKALTVRSENGPASTIVDCGGTEAEPHRGFWFGPHAVEGQVLEGFTIRNGYADYGAGVFCGQYSKPSIRNCVITSNTAAGGGGIYCEYDSSPTIADCRITNNTADGEGGGIGCWFSEATIVNCLITGNTAEWGGALCDGASTARVLNCTITGNTADHAGASYYYASESSITDSILWGNGLEEIVADSAAPTVTFCDVEAGWPGVGNIASDPLFVSGPLHDYYLSQTVAGQAADSPCVDAGSDVVVNLGFEALTTRLDGSRDVGIVDMGYHSPADLTPAEEIALILDFIESSLDDGSLVGNGPGRSANGRLGALINMIEAAEGLAEAGLLAEAYELLLNAYNRCDGETRPPDFVAGEAASQLEQLLHDAMEILSPG